MTEAVAKFEAAGKTVTVIAPTSQASRGVLRDEGFTGAETVAKFLVDTKMQEAIKGQVLIVDEAGLLGTKDMTGLLEVVTRENAQLVLCGDTRQHAAVVRGDALRILNIVADIPTAEVNKIYRQQNEQYRGAVEELSKGNVEAAFVKLDALGFIKTVDPMNPQTEIVNDYVTAVKAGKSVLVISPTHAQGEEVTREIRQRMKTEGLIGNKEIAAVQYQNLNLTEAERKDIRNYQDGQVVKFNQNTKGFVRGSVWNVSVKENEVCLIDAEGKSKALPLSDSRRFSVYVEKEIALSKGDKVLITDNSFDCNDKRLNNGTTLTVSKVSKNGNITLKNDKSGSTYEIKKDFGSIAHAHCITSYASQGKTVDAVFIYQPAATFAATDAKQFYVSVSRAKEQARIYTDDKDELLLSASELGERQSALEVVEKSDRHKNYINQMQRVEREQNIIFKHERDYEPDR
jgi:ATP-dependent exoDNAse (exonuclease V) alpha subunit